MALRHEYLNVFMRLRRKPHSGFLSLYEACVPFFFFGVWAWNHSYLKPTFLLCITSFERQTSVWLISKYGLVNINKNKIRVKHTKAKINLKLTSEVLASTDSAMVAALTKATWSFSFFFWFYFLFISFSGCWSSHCWSTASPSHLRLYLCLEKMTFMHPWYIYECNLVSAMLLVEIIC